MLRGARLAVVAAAQLVPGDIVDVAVGGNVPADLRVVQRLSASLRCVRPPPPHSGGGGAGARMLQLQPAASPQVPASPGQVGVITGCLASNLLMSECLDWWLPTAVAGLWLANASSGRRVLPDMEGFQSGPACRPA